ncbi:hypothetical protein [Agrobacterium pusense]|uniref:hypothetical protein n=1 Tax=Agrobacterium pusense TaxID=648995 RepID=UPI002F3E80C0
MTALLLPLFVLLLGVLFEGGRALVYYNQSKRVMALACEQSTKPTRTDTPEDEDRREAVLSTFDLDDPVYKTKGDHPRCCH